MLKGEISVTDMSVVYGRSLALRGIQGRFEANTMTAIVGPNGAGKSTLVKTIMGLIQPASGTVSRSTAARDIAYLPQAADVARAFPITVADFVLTGAWHRLGAMRGAAHDDHESVDGSLAAVGLKGFGRRSLTALSVGQFQRVLFARLLLQDAAVVVLDEPFAAVDFRTREDLLRIVHRWHAEGRTVIAVLHDFDEVRAHFPQSLLLAREQCGWGPTDAVLTPANLQRANALAEEWSDDLAPALRTMSELQF